MQRFTDVGAWQRRYRFVLEIYRLTSKFPGEERFGLVTQLRRAAASAPTNIAEGWKRQGNQDYARFLDIAEGSLAESEDLLMLSPDLGYLTRETSKPLLDELTEIARMLNGWRKKVRAPTAGPFFTPDSRL